MIDGFCTEAQCPLSHVPLYASTAIPLGPELIMSISGVVEVLLLQEKAANGASVDIVVMGWSSSVNQRSELSGRWY
jgi:hypothetical protein